MNRIKLPLVLLFLIWLGFVLAAFFTVQHPLAMQITSGLLDVILSLLATTTMLINAAALGSGILRRWFPFINGPERVLLGTGLGLGFFGLSGFGLAASGVNHPNVYASIQIVLFAIAGFAGWLRLIQQDFQLLWQYLRTPLERKLAWIPWLVIIFLGLAFILAFAPPADSFDALLYHLAIPEAWLKNGGLTAATIIPHYWYPGLVEGMYTWGLALGSDMVAQFLHLACSVLTVLLIWRWVERIWGNTTAWRAVAVIVSVPSLPLLASWAYTDMTLAFTCATAVYLLWRSLEVRDRRIFALCGVYCGLAMGVKYTSFILPITIVGWIIWKQRRNAGEMLRNILWIGIPAAIVASPWYVRNWIWMGNPVYPFVFGGQNWDPFLAAQYSEAGSGIGWSFLEIILLPINITLGHRDMNFFDGRIGPVWLILLPIALWTLWRIRLEDENKRQGILLPALFALANIIFWTIGVISTAALWQSRLLFPGLMLLAPLMGLAWEKLELLDLQRFRISFILRTLLLIFLSVNLLDLGLFVLVRNPLATALGMNSRQTYYERFQPNYDDALALVDQTPEDARVYFVFEPRSYQMTRSVYADPINQNLAHDFYLYQTPEKVLQAWQAEEYTYVLYQFAGDSLVDNPEQVAQLFSMLEIIDQTSRTVLYRIPAP
ncbi:MAG: glycosyltransferase family 39 protein [Chloroflexota bacterium]